MYRHFISLLIKLKNVITLMKLKQMGKTNGKYQSTSLLNFMTCSVCAVNFYSVTTDCF